jgi:hypothetical protein
MVSRCPIAYVGEDGRIHLTNERGTLDVELEASTSADDLYGWRVDPHPMWSTNGKLVGYTRFEPIPPDRYEQNVVVVEPSSRTVFRPRGTATASFGGWVRDDILNSDGQFVNARTGAFIPKPAWADSMRWVSSANTRAGGGWVVEGTYGLHFRTADFRMGMPIWSSYGAGVGPRVDPTGTWVGWTSLAGEHGHIQIKLIEETVAKKPRDVWPPRVGSVFCDWTADGNIFANVSERGQWGLVVLDKDGTVLRRVVTEVRPLAGSGASWRDMGGGSK